ncbi:MAG: DUF3592 domain-containing protein [Acidobacteria bacterium]|jgi:hypothetical protein|nr:DUF3592 domain-containing protein [Acidobacteriota bacterium]
MFKNQDNKVPRLINRVDRLAPSPRKVPFSITCNLLSNIFVMIGGLLFSFGMLYAWVFSANIHPINEWRLAFSNASAPAVIEKVTETNATDDEKIIYSYYFRFTPGDGLPVYATCYTTGFYWQEGERVPAHYLPDDPNVACLEGARLSQFPYWLIFIIVVFPAVGLAFLIPGTISGQRKIKLLRLGEVTEALDISTSIARTRMNNIPMPGYAYTFRDRMGREFHGVSRTWPTARIGDETHEPVIYLPEDPKQSMLIDALPLKFPIGLDEEGQWQYNRRVFKPLLKFIFVWSLILIHVLIAILKILGI